jgi:UDP-N-acetylmuramyl pentapeptide phosphotransferase/UDP-N-acetylglucosamine-1-phosphate transferase
LGIVAAGATILLVLAAVDEVRTLSRIGRLLVQLLVCAWIVRALSPASALVTGGESIVTRVIAFTVAVGAGAWIVNAYNFMDGINGIAAAEAVVCGLTMGVLFVAHGDLPAALLGFAAAGAALGFLPLNLMGRVFMGDVGSSLLGIIFASLALRGAHDGFAVPIVLPLAPFLFDATTTLCLRAAAGERFFSTPHRNHAYQHLVRRGWSHVAVTGLWTALAIACGAASLVWDSVGAVSHASLGAALLSLHLGVVVLSRRPADGVGHRE